MIKKFDSEVRADVTQLFVNGCMEFHSSALSDRDLYEKFKSKEAIISNPETALAIEVLGLLEGLGFPMDRTGTFFYKDLIVRIINILSLDLASRQDVEASLESPYSQLYFDVARNDLDVGIKTFNSIVQEAFANIDVEKANPELLESVVSRMEGEVSNNQLPLVIAEHSKSLNVGQSMARAIPISESETEAN